MVTKTDCIIIFTKSPVPGHVKTRLIPYLGAEQACALYKKMLLYTVQQASLCHGADIQLWCYPDTDHTDIQQLCRNFDISLHQQVGDDLGERMFNALQYNNTKNTVLIGCDCPQIDTQLLQTALEQLRIGCDVVIGPANDGGYYLIGMQLADKKLFQNIEWGSHEVLQQTKKRMQESNKNCFTLKCLSDVDTPEDIQQYELELKQKGLLS